MRMTGQKVAMGLLLGSLLLLPEGCAGPGNRSSLSAQPSQEDVQTLIQRHREAAARAREKVVYHEEMEKNAIAGKWGGKFDMVGHCRFWADHYRKLAEKEEQAAREMEKSVR